MAQKNSRSIIIALLCVVVLVQKGNAFQFKVGGSNGWAPPSDPNSNGHNQWAEKNRFQIGDSLLFEYSGNSDSVLYVNKDDYANCNTENPVQKFTDGHTVFKFEHSGPHYFISGVKDNCLKNEKLVVVVMADRTKSAPSPAPSPSNDIAAASPTPSNDTATSPPSPTPSAETPSPPSPAPTSEESPSPPSDPAAAPSQESNPPHKNGASSVVTGFIAAVGAFAGSSSFLLFL